MPSEQLIQLEYFANGQVKGSKYGPFERLQLGQTTASALLSAGVLAVIPDHIDFPFSAYKVPKKTSASKADDFYLRRLSDGVEIVAIREMKTPNEFNTEAKRQVAIEQGLYSAAVVGAKVAIISDGNQYLYVDVISSLEKKEVVFVDDRRDLNPGVLENLLSGDATTPRDPSQLAEKVWQAIWHATKQEPKECLMTFVEIFILKFLSDNLPTSVLPNVYRFYELTASDDAKFVEDHGKTQIEYYVQEIRGKIKTIFPDKTTVSSSVFQELFGFATVVSPTSVINGFAFLQSGSTSLATFNRTFVTILRYFEDFGPLTNIHPEFKLRLYETFLKKTVRQSKLGQFFTPRNVVRAIVRMAELNKLPADAIVLDPAAGVGGFVLEPIIDENSLEGNVTFANGVAHQKIRMVGIDADVNTHILAKANTLLHLAEAVRDPNVTVRMLNNLMAEMFIVLNSNQHLGTLEHPIQSKVDVIITNPPYVTQGSKIFKDEINNFSGLRNGQELKTYYDRVGLGLESLFLRYISGALKPGGRGYVIVPQGLLTRTEPAAKEKLLSECNLLASISLPRNTFFNTPQKTFILVVEKRHTKVDARPDVFTAIVSSIGESLDARRVTMLGDNTLDEVASAFLAHTNSEIIPTQYANRVRIVPSANFSSSDRWDVQRFWTEEELVQLGAKEAAVERTDFINDVKDQITQIAEELGAVQQELAALEAGPMTTILIGDEDTFVVRRGTRITRATGDANPGLIPVYSGSKDPNRPITSVSEEWAKKQLVKVEERPVITVNANGYVGACFVRREKCIIHDDVMVIETKVETIDYDYLAQALRSSIAAGDFAYEAKLYNRVKELSVKLPVKVDGTLDLDRQVAIAGAVKRFDSLRESLTELGKWATESRISE